MAAELVPLSDLPAGTVARLRETRLDDESCRLLRALGLTEASRLRLCTDGEPFIVQVRSTRIGLSKAVACGLFVTVEADA